MNKDRVVIKEGGMRFEFEMSFDGTACTDCIIGKMGGGCHANSQQANYLCKCLIKMDDGFRLKCISATKIEPEPKMYFAWNREEARHLVGKDVEFHGGYSEDEWTPDRLDGILSDGVPFALRNSRWAMIIREVQTIELTRAELNEKYGVPGNVVIVD